MLSSSSSNTNVNVAVRIRPLNDKERQQQNQSIACLSNPNQICLRRPKDWRSSMKDDFIGIADRDVQEDKFFTFDHVYAEDCQQQHIFHDLGVELLDHAFEGFNASILAYGQTCSGKSHTMMGPPCFMDEATSESSKQTERGLIPRIGQALFERMDQVHQQKTSEPVHFNVEVSYMEI
jgi:kinesin family protein 1